MITDGFDKNSKPFITPKALYGEAPRNDMVCIVTYQKDLFEYVLNNYESRLFKQYKTTGGLFDIYQIKVNGKNYLFYNTLISATLTATLMIEIASITGCHHFVFFGSCGVLNEEKCRGRIIVPTEAYRDEGISYHYAEPSDYIKIKHTEDIIKVLEDNKLSYVSGRVWTTDGFYMETEVKLAKRKEEGCLAVEMEIAGVQATANYYDLETYPILFPADSLDDLEWDRADFGGSKELVQQIKSFEVATKIAESLLK